MKILFLFAFIIIHVFQLSGQGSKTISIKANSLSDPNKKILYFGIENELLISAKGYTPEKIFVRINKKVFEGINGKYMVKISYNDTLPGKKVIVNVSYINKSKDTVSIGNEEFKALYLQDPIPKVAGKNSGTIKKEELLKADSLSLDIPENYLKYKFKIRSFSLSISQGIIKSYSQPSGNTFTIEQKDILQSAKKDQKIFFEDIKAEINGKIIACPVICLKIKD